MEINRDNLLEVIRTGLARDNLSISGLEKQAGVPKDTIRDFLRAKTQVLRADKLQKIMGILQPEGKVAITAYMGKNAKILESESQDEMVDCPAGMSHSDVIAVKIENDAMMPVFHVGWVVYYSPKYNISLSGKVKQGTQVPYNKIAKKKKGEKADNDPMAEFLGKPCIIQIKKGPLVLRTLKKGGKPKRYHLISYNADDIKNAEVEWAAKIIFIKT